MPRSQSTAPVPARADSVRRTEILRAAAELFASAGYAGTNVKDVADACGILPGSLYHHFESKEAIAVELLERYHAALDAVARSAPPPSAITGADQAFDVVNDYATALAACALEHRAALQLSIYEPHTGAGTALIALAADPPSAPTTAMRALLDAAADHGYLTAAVDRCVLAEQLCQTMLHIGLSVLHRENSADRVATVVCRLLLDGLPAVPASPAALDRSAALRAARESIATWANPDDTGDDDRTARLRAVARAEFARRGYEATTMRDIATAAGMGAGSVYRTVESKQALLDSIMGTFHDEISRAYAAVVGTDSSAVAKLDALTWINLNALRRFDLEFAIQRAWFRSTPPDTSDVIEVLRRRARQIAAVVDQGRADGEITIEGITKSRLSACVRDLIWMPPPVVARVGIDAAHAHSRATLLCGATRTALAA
ncbi:MULTISPECIES: TetR/AcrR family transcriptional regulator [Nocardia]|uniref:TetR/AcrR family transcriptional regulator n=2 Tax=Nocardia TaxID=1817 RepID=A0A2T2ZAG7_9NOCA|nr:MULTISPECIES: TetR/AcrR family transcriptional regulator [Nocardia]MBF6449259.1 TetR/AcrR family transcriptional regulator [Nocardia elegans]PSR64746.1 TetR/AcrR family transcriptional regulator [Nocardia nova]